jgi:putative GTP pyrophosphokinase
MNIEEEHIQTFTKDWKKYDLLGDKVSHLIGEVLTLKSLKTHAISFRAKDIDSFRRKIERKKYVSPINDVTDLCGVRIIAYVEDDVQIICEEIRQMFEVDELRSVNKNAQLGADRVGYKSIHLICKLKEDRSTLPEYSSFKDMVFEIQVRTILQHSWAEIEHDKNYKFAGVLPEEIKRRLMLLSGALEILDREFNMVSREIDQYAINVKDQANTGNFGIDINSISISEYIDVKFKKLIEEGVLSHAPLSESGVLQELREFGINTLQDLDQIIPEDMIDVYLKTGFSGSTVGLLRDIMLINDIDKYYQLCYHGQWTYYGEETDVLNHYGINLAKFHRGD